MTFFTPPDRRTEKPALNCRSWETSNHDRLPEPGLGFTERLWLHAVDTVGIVHAMLLRLQALLMPVRTLVLSGGH